MAINLNIRGKVLSAFGIAVLGSVLTGGAIWLSNQTVADNVAWTVHTYTVIGETDRLLESLVDQETGLRGYLITEDSGSLAPLR